MTARDVCQATATLQTARGRAQMLRTAVTTASPSVAPRSLGASATAEMDMRSQTAVCVQRHSLDLTVTCVQQDTLEYLLCVTRSVTSPLTVAAAHQMSNQTGRSASASAATSTLDAAATLAPPCFLETVMCATRTVETFHLTSSGTRLAQEVYRHPTAPARSSATLSTIAVVMRTT